MHDGQNVFDAATSFSGEWGVDESLDTLGPEVGESIVVAIDNGGDKRINEYSPYDVEKFGKGEGDLYVDFLVKTLKPFIEKNYRVKKRRKHTFYCRFIHGWFDFFLRHDEIPQNIWWCRCFFACVLDCTATKRRTWPRVQKR